MLHKQTIPPLHDVDIRLLRVFKSVVECGGLSAAEYTLGVGRSAISKHLSELETRLMVRLCERGRSGFTTTPYGETVYQATIELLDALDQFRAQVSAAKGTLTGSVSLCLMDNLHLEAGNPVALAVQRFSERSSDVTLTLGTVGPEEAEDAVSARLADVAITSSNSGLAELTYFPLSVHRSTIYAACLHNLEVCPAKHPIPADLNVVTPAYLSRDHSLIARTWRSTAIANDLEATIQLILSGHFVGLLPEHVADPWVIRGRMKQVSGQPTLESQTYLAVRTKSKNVPVIRTLTDDIAAAYEMSKARWRQ